MKLQSYLLLFVLVYAIACKTKDIKQDAFKLSEQKKTSLGLDGTAEFFYWDFLEAEELWKLDFTIPDEVERFRDSLSIVLGSTLFDKTIAKESTQAEEFETTESEENGDVRNAKLVHSGKVGHIRAINALEAEILNYQLAKYPLLSHPTEFHAFIAYHEELDAYRVYFGASHQPWPPHPDLLLEQLNEDIQTGWKLKYHLHNHYEPVSNNYLGILAPSMADAQYFQMLSERYELTTALITNGFHTVELTAAHFSQFVAH